MVSDVPVGLFLSGGFDSGSILSLLASSGFASTAAICLDFPDAEFSEYALAKRTSEQFGGVLHRHVIDAAHFLNALPAFFDAMDQPTNDGFNTYFVCQAARESGIKVWMSGVGGDEVFGGYPSFARLAGISVLARVLGHVPKTLLNWGAVAARSHPRLNRVVHLGDKGSSDVRAFQTLRNAFPWRLARYVLSPSWDSSWRFPDLLDSVYPDPNPRADNYQLATLFESLVYMRSQLLRDIDNFSMVHSLELRAPFLSHKLFESVYLLQRSLKHRPGAVKPLLAEALPRPLPKEIRAQSKRGFTFPLEIWLRSFIRTSFEEVVFDTSMRNIWDQDAVRRLWKAYLAGRVRWGMMWQLYAFARWRAHACVR
jgi:asparagine synthase (glutamine-hydrolysing)